MQKNCSVFLYGLFIFQSSYDDFNNHHNLTEK